MVIAWLVLLGLCAGSFINALVWRLHEQAELSSHKVKKDYAKKLRDLSVVRGRSMCPHCHHELSMADLIPVFSWLWLRGKCRYCQKPISWQYPVVESITAMSFIVSYLAWPSMLSGWESINFGLWLVILTGLIALIVYDLRWMLLPNRIIFPLLAVAVIKDVILLRRSGDPLHQFIEVIGALAISGGIFYLIFQFSAGKWIGGGDVKLGLLLGLVLAQPSFALLQVFLASLLGTLAILPAWIRHRVTSTSKVPYGPFLILSTFIVILWGSHIINWYQNLFSSGHF